MDLRVKKTKSSVVNAFLQLRAKKPLERITVKELSDLAEINKATFYLHYKDIYDLSETLENELFESVFNSIEHPNSVLSEPKLFVKELTNGFIANRSLIDIIFAHGRKNILADRLESEVKRFIYEKYPLYKDSPKLAIALTYMIKGSYYAYDENSGYGTDEVINAIGEMAEGIVAKLNLDL
ncbi:MAG: TetR/AcrR family transcriptional regulator [Lachnospiraceae bacterium]|nr:TetR/AcrR family transcriptional regulator [Ruminococcus sp.]MCM1274865.1 TetR/AcrR family transcriptional regulator [Lachnospiraceae bacterium]